MVYYTKKKKKQQQTHPTSPLPLCPVHVSTPKTFQHFLNSSAKELCKVRLGLKRLFAQQDTVCIRVSLLPN